MSLLSAGVNSKLLFDYLLHEKRYYQTAPTGALTLVPVSIIELPLAVITSVMAALDEELVQLDNVGFGRALSHVCRSAAIAGDIVDRIKLLIDRGADPNIQWAGMTPLQKLMSLLPGDCNDHNAHIWEDMISGVNVLVDSGANVDMSVGDQTLKNMAKTMKDEVESVVNVKIHPKLIE
jgi:hypothetical protein